LDAIPPAVVNRGKALFWFVLGSAYTPVVIRWSMSMSTDPYVSRAGGDMATQFMLVTLFRVVSDMGTNPGEFLADVRAALYDLTASYKLPPMPAAQDEAIREHAKAIITGVLASAGAPQPH
jgi:hypothetical protein